jgi:ABC-2 type transport system ATP-binding protein
MSIISVENLVKKYYTPQLNKGFFNTLSSLFSRKYTVHEALNNISFTINEGELVGYIGPNGAGKSTTVKILSGILVPTSGHVSVLGKTPWQHRIDTVKNLGVVFGQRTQLWWDLPVIESFELLKDIYSLPDILYKKTLESLTDILDLSPLYHTPARHLSLGQRMRCDLAASLLHKPKILFLDEPTIGLDAISKLTIRKFIQHINKENNITILLTTHDMDDIETLCKRVLILNKGNIFLDGSLDIVRKKISPERRLIIDLVHENETISEQHVTLIKQEGPRVWLSFNPTHVSIPELISYITSKHAIQDLYIENPPIEEIVAQFYKDANT